MKRCLSDSPHFPLLNYSNSGALAIFARTPVPGKAKTRLIRLLGANGAAGFQAALIADSLRKFSSLGNRFALFLMSSGAQGAAVASPTGAEATAVDLHPYRIERQRGPDLGARLERAFTLLLRDHSRAVVIGTDSPELQASTVIHVFRELLRSDAVLGPCGDGGYYLVGLRRGGGGGISAKAGLPESLFQGVRWGTSSALRDTARNFHRHGLSCTRLEPLVDIDRPADLLELRRRMASSSGLRRRAPATWRFLSRFEKSL